MIEIKSNKIITPNGLRSGYLYIDNGIIDCFSEKKKCADEYFDFNGKYVSPGFIDLHTHGAGGYPFINGTEEDVIYRDIEDEVEKKLLKKAIDRLGERERMIIDLRFGLSSPDDTEMTQKEVADLMGISQSYISRLEKKIIKRLKKEIVKYE